MRIECPKPAYDRIIRAGIDNIIRSRREQVSDILQGMDFSGQVTLAIFRKSQKALKRLKNLSERASMYKQILELEAIVEEEGIMSAEKEDLLIKYPDFLGFAVLGKELLDYQKFRFPSRKSLAEAITSFCIGEREETRFSSSEYYIWRNKSFKNWITNSWHGDLWFGQIDVSGRDEEKIEHTLLGEKKTVEFDAWKDADKCTRVVNAHDGNWPAFLMINLRYAEALGKQKMPEITDWKQCIAGKRLHAPATTEGMFGDTYGSINHLLQFADSALLGTIQEGETEKMPLGISTNSQRFLCAYVKDRKLYYLSMNKEGKEGEIEINWPPIYRGKRFSSYMVFDESDLPQLLTGTYMMFGRDRSHLPKIMDFFNGSLDPVLSEQIRRIKSSFQNR